MTRTYYNEKQKGYAEKYEKANIKRYVLKVNKNTEGDIIAFLDGLKSFNGEIKRMIREEMKRNG